MSRKVMYPSQLRMDKKHIRLTVTSGLINHMPSLGRTDTYKKKVTKKHKKPPHGIYKEIDEW